MGEFTLKSVHADAGAVKLPHDKPVLVDKIINSPLLILNSLEPLVLVHMPFDDLYLGGQNVMQVSALVEHNPTRPLLKSLKL